MLLRLAKVAAYPALYFLAAGIALTTLNKYGLLPQEWASEIGPILVACGGGWLTLAGFLYLLSRLFRRRLKAPNIGLAEGDPLLPRQNRAIRETNGGRV